jgi:glycosyltransferase involved in cell wall biosynthesis
LLGSNPVPSLLLIGHFPPPRGGVAAHLERLRASLPQHGITPECYTFGAADARHRNTVAIKGHRLAFFLRLCRGASLLHYHTDEADWKSALLMGVWCLLRRQRFIFTLHSFRSHAFQRRPLFGWLMKLVFRSAERIVCISENLKREVVELLPVDPSILVVIPSYIPPSAEERDRPLPPGVEQFLNTHPVTIAFNAYNAVRFGDGDLYGGDTILDAMAILTPGFPELGAVMVYTRTADLELWRTIQARAVALGDRVLLIKADDLDFVPVAARAPISVRATRNDGGPSLTVLEALSLGRFILASDAVPRPPQAIMFKTGDPGNLAGALRTTIERVKREERQEPVAFATALDGLLPLYRTFLS